jgi:hypothetical protein
VEAVPDAVPDAVPAGAAAAAGSAVSPAIDADEASTAAPADALKTLRRLGSPVTRISFGGVPACVVTDLAGGKSIRRGRAGQGTKGKAAGIIGSAYM